MEEQNTPAVRADIALPINAETMNTWAGLTKKQQYEKATVAIGAITGAYINPLQGYEAIKAVYETCKLVIDNGEVKNMVADEINRYGKGEPKPYGHEATVREGGMDYDFEACNDSILNKLYEDLKTLKAKIKNREEWLKMLSEPAVVVDTDTGEEYTAHPPNKTKKPPVVIIKFKDE